MGTALPGHLLPAQSTNPCWAPLAQARQPPPHTPQHGKPGQGLSHRAGTGTATRTPPEVLPLLGHVSSQAVGTAHPDCPARKH